MMKILPFALAALTLGGCNIIPDPAPPNVVYRLSLTGDSVQPDPDATVIRVDRPSANSVFASRSIVVSPDGRRLSTAAQAQWPEALPIMLQDTLVDAFSRQPGIVAVLPQSGTRSDTRIHMTIKNFEAQFDRGESAAPLAVVRYTATLANATDRKLIDTFVVRKEMRTDNPRVSDIVKALEAANNEAMKDIVAWVLSVDAKGMMASAEPVSAAG